MSKCPGCGIGFPSERACKVHLNHKHSKCKNWLKKLHAADASDSQDEGVPYTCGNDHGAHVAIEDQENGFDMVDVEMTHDGDISEGQVEDMHPGISVVQGKGMHQFDRIRSKDKHQSQRKKNPFYPFSCFTEWEVANWIGRAGLTQAMIDEFLALRYVWLYLYLPDQIQTFSKLSFQVKKRPFSFKSHADYRSRIEALPGGPAWMSKNIKVPGAVSKTLLTLYYRDALKVFEFLFGYPAFDGFMDMSPRKVWQDSRRLHRVYTGIMTGNWAWKAQVCRNNDCHDPYSCASFLLG